MTNQEKRMIVESARRVAELEAKLLVLAARVEALESRRHRRTKKEMADAV